MKNYCCLFLLFALLSASCKPGKKQDDQARKYISIPSIIEQEVAHIDTSLYSIVKITGTDSLHSDTVFIKREDFRKEAESFLNVTDLSDPGNASRFKEESTYDTLIKRVIITYTPLKPEKEEIKKQQLLVSTEQDAGGNNKIKSILVERSSKNRDGAISQQMLWNMGKSFLVNTTTQKPGEPEKITITRVTWNEDNH